MQYNFTLAYVVDGFPCSADLRTADLTYPSSRVGHMVTCLKDHKMTALDTELGAVTKSHGLETRRPSRSGNWHSVALVVEKVLL